MEKICERTSSLMINFINLFIWIIHLLLLFVGVHLTRKRSIVLGRQASRKLIRFAKRIRFSNTHPQSYWKERWNLKLVSSKHLLLIEGIPRARIAFLALLFDGLKQIFV